MPKFTLKTATIPLSDDDADKENAIVVRGLSPNDIMQLYGLHRAPLELIFNQFAGRDPETISESEAATVASEMVENMPGLAAHIIALAADDTESFDDYVKLPLGTQVDAIEKIGALTFASSGGPKKIFALVRNFAGRMKSAKSESPAT